MKKSMIFLVAVLTVVMCVGCGKSKQTADNTNVTNETSTQSQTVKQTVADNKETTGVESTETVGDATTDSTEQQDQIEEQQVAQNDEVEAPVNEPQADASPAEQPAPVTDVSPTPEPVTDAPYIEPDTTPATTPEPTQPTVVMCPYETLKWTYYEGHFGFFCCAYDDMRTTADMSAALYTTGPVPSIEVGCYYDKGFVYFEYNDELNEDTVKMPY